MSLPAELIGLIHDLGAGPERWETVLAALGGLIGCPALGFFGLDATTGASRMTIAVGHDDHFRRAYEARWGRPEHNAYGGRVEPAQLVPAAWLPAASVCDDRELLRSAYFDEWLRPQRLGCGGFGVIITPARGVTVLSVARSRARGHLDADETATMEAVLRHVQRATEREERLAEAEAARAALEASLETVDPAVLMLDARGRVLHQNLRARELLAAADGLRQGPDGLHAADGRTTGALRRLVAAAAHGEGGALALPRPSGRRPLQLVANGLPRRSASGEATVLLIVRDPAQPPEVPAAMLQDLFRLTPSEARLVALLVAGRSLDEAAVLLDVSRATVRTHLRHVLAKLDAHNQTEAIRRVVSAVGALRL
jgi:DNA-binding CsgD family transcriptional regulator